MDDISITTNGLLTQQYIPRLKASGIKSVNLSLDTLNPERFFSITRRRSFDKVMKTLDSLLKHKITVKINTVVMEDQNIEDIIPLVLLTKKLPVDVRFIEEMPFNGTDAAVSLKWNYKQIYEHIKAYFPDIIKQKIRKVLHHIIIKFRDLQAVSELLQHIPAPSAETATEYELRLLENSVPVCMKRKELT